MQSQISNTYVLLNPLTFEYLVSEDGETVVMSPDVIDAAQFSHPEGCNLMLKPHCRNLTLASVVNVRCVAPVTLTSVDLLAHTRSELERLNLEPTHPFREDLLSLMTVLDATGVRRGPLGYLLKNASLLAVGLPLTPIEDIAEEWRPVSPGSTYDKHVRCDKVMRHRPVGGPVRHYLSTKPDETITFPLELHNE